MSWEYNKLREKIKEACGTQECFARKLGIGSVSLSQCLNNQFEFSQDEIFKSCDILGIDVTDISVYFLPEKVGKLNNLEAEKGGTR